MAKRPIFYDTETTGVRAATDRIIEIAAYDPVRDKTFERFVNPGMPIPPEATAIHHISDEMVADAPNFSVIANELVEFCEGEAVLIAHNNDGFDMHFLRAEFGRHNVALPDWKYLDTLKWARRYRPDLPRHTLQFLREIYGIEANNAHRALDDVIVLYKVFQCMVDDLNFDDVCELMNRKQPDITHMPFGKHQGVLLADIPKSYLRWLAESGALDKPDNQHLKECLAKQGLLGVPDKQNTLIESFA